MSLGFSVFGLWRFMAEHGSGVFVSLFSCGRVLHGGFLL